MRSTHGQRMRSRHGQRMRSRHGQREQWPPPRPRRRRRSRSLVIAAAWGLGVLTALGGSFLAGNAIARLATGAPTATAPIHRAAAVHQASTSQPAGGDAGDQDPATPQLQPALIAAPQPTPQAGSHATSPAQPAAPQVAPSKPSPTASGSLVVSPGGSVMASCQNGLAYLQSWTPSQGYQADDVIRGPASQARIGFEQGTSEYEISVTCNGSNPVATVTAG